VGREGRVVLGGCRPVRKRGEGLDHVQEGAEMGALTRARWGSHWRIANGVCGKNPSPAKKDCQEKSQILPPSGGKMIKGDGRTRRASSPREICSGRKWRVGDYGQDFWS